MTAYLDGNVLGGMLGDVFAVDVTTAVSQCNSCGTSSVLGEAVVYADAPGTVARCPTCHEIMLRVVRGEGRAWLDLRGMTSLELISPS
jgi:Zn finger protein HypA/HybF involved in hydrogenase expression